MPTPTPGPPVGHVIPANGLDIYYTEQGQGAPLLLIHGGALTGASWQPYLARFAAHYRVLMPDSRGHGRTPHPGGPLSFRLLAADMVAFVQALDLSRPLIYGYSDGGQVALEIGMHYPDLPRALVVGGAHLELTEGSRQWVRSIRGAAESPEVDPARFAREQPEFAALLEELHGAEGWPRLLRHIKPLWNAALNYTAADFARVVAPTLVLLGDRDAFVPLEDGVGLYRRLGQAELAVVPGADHTDLIFSSAHVARVQPLIVDFLQRHAAAGGPPGPDAGPA